MKIGFCGTMSVGKTTLVNELAKLSEFKNYTSRTERSKHLRDLGIPLNMDSTLKGQFVFAAERASELLCDKILTDRTVIDVMAFCELSESMTANEAFYLNSALGHLIDDYDYLFYVSPVGVKMEDNGIRETDIKYRDEINKKILSILDLRDIKYTTIQGTTEERIKLVKQTISL
jgi:nicotinamide riboside kinase|tara:strand:- start:501 stop:1022 length:522 start_codon:yes stop_codon:yes gene_type:complete